MHTENKELSFGELSYYILRKTLADFTSDLALIKAANLGLTWLCKSNLFRAKTAGREE